MGEYSDEAMRIHADLPVVDGHNDLPWRIRVEAGSDLAVADPSGPLPEFHTDIGRMIAGGVGAQFWSVYVPASVADPFSQTLRQIDLVEEMVGRDDRLVPARTAVQARAARQSGRIGALLGAEGGHSIENSIDNLAVLAGRGVRYMTLTHSDTTDWADSATDAHRHGGLSTFGRDVVAAMNDLGVLVDISHVSADTMRDAIDASDRPVIASHSNAFALAGHPRNIPDDVLRAVGQQGGVVMAVFFPGFVVPSTAQRMLDLFDTWRQITRDFPNEADAHAEVARIEASLDLDLGDVAAVVDHIEYIAELAGVDAVGVGSDFDGMTITPDGLGDVSCYPAITDELLDRGWVEPDIRKVLGDNALRALAAAE
jgi:membrane dipeptidase